MPVNTKLYQSVFPLKNDATTVYTKDKVEPLLNSKKNTTDLFDTNKVQYVDSVLNANKDKEWIQRLVQPQKTATSIQDPYESQYRSTHLMSDDGNGYVYPEIIRNEKNELEHWPTTLNLLGNENESKRIEYARKNKIGIQLPKKQGTWFANNGYKIGSGVNNDIDSITGIPFHNPNYELQK